MKINWIILLIFICNGYSQAQMKKPHEWVNYEKVFGVKNGLRNYDYDVKTIYSNTPANILWPKENIHFIFQVVNQLNEQMDENLKVYLVRYGVKGVPNDIWLPEVFKLEETLIMEKHVSISPKGYLDVDVLPDVPEIKGGYAVVFDLGKYGRMVGTSFVRSIKPVLGKMQYPKQSLDDLGVDFLSRVGVQAIRYGLSFCPSTHRDYQIRMSRLREEMEKYKRNNITVMIMFEEGPASMPLGTTRPHLDEKGVFKRTKQDHVWLPENDPEFKKFVNTVCTEFGWPRGPVTSVCLWNEPWESASISGWQSDIERYREIYRAMAAGVLEARKTGVDVLVGGADSNSNAMDKFFCDGKWDFLPIFDFLSIHYQGMEAPVLYPEWNNRKDYKGRVLIWDTESWVGNTDDRIGLVVSANRSAGYDRSMGIYGGYMYSGDPHLGRSKTQFLTKNGMEEIDPINTTWSPAAAMGAVQFMIGERNFKELLFKNGLPWVMVFDGYNGNPDDGTVVVTGDLGEAFGYENILYRGVRGQKEANEKINIRKKMVECDKSSDEYKRLEKQLATYLPLEEGWMTIKAQTSFCVYDFYGNELNPENGMYRIPLTFKGYYLRTNGKKGTFDALLRALKISKIEGYEPVEIKAKDFTGPIESRPEMELVLTNILNRPVSGNLQVSIEGLVLEYPKQLSFKEHETKSVRLKTISGESCPTNEYSLEVLLDAGKDGVSVHWENMHVNYIAKRTITVDGDLNDWKDILPQTIRTSGESAISQTEAAWYPFMEFDTRADGMSTAYLAYDDQYFYFAAKVADSTPNSGNYRFEKLNPDEFFYPDTAYRQTVTGMHATKVNKIVTANNEEALQMPDGNGRVMNYIENTETTQSIGLALDLPLDVYTRTSLFFPNMNQLAMRIVVTNRETGNELLAQSMDKVWNGAYLTMDLSGKVDIRCSALGWWYTAKIGAVFFDKGEVNVNAETSGLLIDKDFNTKGNWKNVYGNEGFLIMGLPAQLPAGVSCQIIEKDDLIPMVWLEGVRHYTYRKRFIIPDGSMNRPVDNVLIAFNVIPMGEDGMEAFPNGTIPGYIGYKCTDYEYALNTVADEFGGGFEIWRMLVPGMPRKHFFPRQPHSPFDGPIKDGQLISRREGNTLYTECAIPWSEIPDVKKALDKGEKIKFSYRVNDDGAGAACMELARKRSVSKKNSRAFHPDWKEHWANELEFEFGK